MQAERAGASMRFDRLVSLLALLVTAGGCGTATAVVSTSEPVTVTVSPEKPQAAATAGVVSGVVSGVPQEGRLAAPDRLVRVAIEGKTNSAPVSATGRFSVSELGGTALLVRGEGGEAWQVEQSKGLLRVSGANGDATPWRQGPFVLRMSGNPGMVQYKGRRYRGELWLAATDSGVLVVNRLGVEDYLRGVVPFELGSRQPGDAAALEAQTIAARSYTYTRVPAGTGRQELVPASGWHVVNTVLNQVYGGADVEHALVNHAVDVTAGLVVRYNGVTVDAPYSSSCGGRTASPRDAWRDAGDQPYLQPVDDTDPRSGKPYCDISPRNHWVEEINEPELREVVMRAIAAAGTRSVSVGTVQELRVAQRSASGRIGTFTIRTDRGDVSVRANELRSVFRNSSNVILPSTSFSIDRESRTRGHLTGVTLRGAGNGHGVGMCQWGAIGRSRAGQNAAAILRHYYPGTTVGYAD